MNRNYCLIISLVIGLAPVNSFASEIKYPANQVARPLTLPAGVMELGIGVARSEWNNRNSFETYPLFSIRYGLTSDIELYLLGVKYRLLTENKPVELALKTRIAGLGKSDAAGTIVLAEVGAEAKHRITPSISLHYLIEEYYGFYSSGGDVSDLRLSIGQTVAFTNNFSIGILATYRKLDGFTAESAGFASGFIRYNFSSRVDIVFEGSAGDFEESDDLRHEMKSSRHEYGASLIWRF